MVNGIIIGDLSIDSKDPDSLQSFYAGLLGWEKRTMWNCPALLSPDGKMCFLFMKCECDYTPPVWPEEPGKQQKQMHFNFQVDNLPQAVEEAERLGASKAKAQFGGDDFITMLDPDGHPFCLCRK